jgi:GH24 family phage-related lysozyme (muramidase)
MNWIETLKTRLRREEGVVLTMYRDSEGHPSVGVGFNLDRHDAGTRLRSLGLSLTAVKAGWPITREQAEALLDYDVRAAATDASDLVGRVIFEELPEVVQIAMADMAFNMGIGTGVPGGLDDFHKMLAAVRSGDFMLAAREMLDSKWHKQVGKRAEELAAMVKSAAKDLTEDERKEVLAQVGLSLRNLAGEQTEEEKPVDKIG